MKMETGVTFQSSIEEIQEALDEVNKRFEEYESKEPKNESSAAHKEWEQQCEELAVISETLMTWIDKKMAAAQGL